MSALLPNSDRESEFPQKAFDKSAGMKHCENNSFLRIFCVKIFALKRDSTLILPRRAGVGRAPVPYAPDPARIPGEPAGNGAHDRMR
jgi:hypothetical protein